MIRAALVIVWLFVVFIVATSRGGPADLQQPALPGAPQHSASVMPAGERPAPSGTERSPSGNLSPSSGASSRPAVATTRPPATLDSVTRQGDLAWADKGHGWDYLAIPIGPGYRVMVCGPADCVLMRSTDSGPNHAMLESGRIADVAVRAWERVCGVDRRFGLCPGSWTVIGR